MSNAKLPHTPRIFISHNSADNDLGYRLVRDLRAMYGEDAVWYDSRGGILPGDPWPERLQLELTARDTFIILLSPDSVRSRWVNDEINMAWQQHNSPRGKVIIPILVRPCDIPPYLATIQYVSFLPDPNHPYELALAELVNAIRLAKTRFHEIQRKPLIPQGPPHDTLLAPEHFVGRVADLAWVMDRLRQGGATAITALNGMGGIGKTALASEAARHLRDDENRFRDGTIVVDCREVYDAAAILRTVLGRFPLDGSLDEATLPTLANLIRQHLRDKDILVLLDNIEPARPGWRVQDATRPLRDAGATLLLTSRQPLPGDAVPPDARYPLHLMRQDDALDLFSQSYGLPNAAALSAEDRAAATSIIATLERHTLAVKLAGAYARDLARDLATLAAELASDPLKVPADDETPRAVALLFARSVDQLPPCVQRLFAALAAFATAEFGRRAALAVAQAVVPTVTTVQQHAHPQPQSTTPTDNLTAEDALDLLIRRALLDALPTETPPPAQSEDEDTEVDRERLRLHALIRRTLLDAIPPAAPPSAQTGATQVDRERLRLHALVRHYAASRLTLHSRQQTNLAIATWYAAYAKATPDPDLAPDEQNIIGALEWVHSVGPDTVEDATCDELIADLCASMSQFWRDRGKTSASLRYLPWGIEALHSRDQWNALGYIYRDYGYALFTFGKIDRSLEAYNQALEIFREHDHEIGVARMLEMVGRVEARLGHLEKADKYYHQAETIFREKGDDRSLAILLSQLGQIAQQRGRLDDAERYFQQSLAIRHEVSDRRGEGIVLSNLGRIAQQRGRLDDAERYFQQSLAIHQEVSDRRNEGVVLANLGHIARRRGRLDEAERDYQQSLAIHQEVSDRQGEGVVLAQLAVLAEMRDDYPHARQQYSQALDALRETEDAIDYAGVAHSFARLLLAHGSDAVRAEGCALLAEALRLYKQMGIPDADYVRATAAKFGCDIEA